MGTPRDLDLKALIEQVEAVAAEEIARVKCSARVSIEKINCTASNSIKRVQCQARRVIEKLEQPE